MAKKQRDYSVFDRFNFERKPVGVKFLITKPEGIKRRGKGLNICEMFKEAQTSAPFYAGEEDFELYARTMREFLQSLRRIGDTRNERKGDPPDSKSTPEDPTERARDLAKRGEYDNAFAELLRAFETDPWDSDALDA